MRHGKHLSKASIEVENCVSDRIGRQRGTEEIICLNEKRNTDRQIEEQIHEIDY